MLPVEPLVRRAQQESVGQAAFSWSVLSGVSCCAHLTELKEVDYKIPRRRKTE